MEKMKILQVNKLYYPEIGGIEKTLQQISEGLNDTVDLKVLVCQKRGRGATELVNGVEVHRSGSLGVVSSVPISFSFLWNLRKMSKGRDVVQYHLPFPLGDLGCLLSGYHGKVVAYWHSDVVKQKKWMILYKPVMKRFLQRADVILVGAGGIIEGSCYLDPYREKCKVVPFAVTDDILRAGGNYLTQCGYQKRKKSINFLFIGRLVYYKGCSVLLKAFAGLGGDAILTIVGEGDLREELERQTEVYKLVDRVFFKGHVNDSEMKRCMEEADVFVFPSVERSEAFGLVQLEAMAYGMPVINTRLPSGVPEVSIHGETGLTVAPGSVEELAEALEWMVTHPQERLEMGKEARKRVEEKYTQAIMIGNIRRIYEELYKDRN